MSVLLDDLKKQLAASEAELEQAKAHVYRLDGAIQMLRHFISDAEKPDVQVTEVPKEN